MAAVIAAVLTLLAAPVTEAIALAPAESPSTYVYDSHHHPALVTGVVTERGPPATHDSTTTDEGGLRSLGDLARPNGPTTPATYDYNDLGQFAQIARGCKLAEERADGAPAALAVVQRSGVAAKTGDGLADDVLVVRGGTSDVPGPGQLFSGAHGRTLDEAAAGVPHGQIRVTTVGQIRSGGGTVDVAPELTRSGVLNERHVNICLGSGPCPFGPLQPNPVPKSGRIQ